MLITIYNIAISNRKENKVMTKAQENLKIQIEEIKDEEVIEKVRIFIMGILAQQRLESINKSHKSSHQTT